MNSKAMTADAKTLIFRSSLCAFLVFKAKISTDA